MKCLLVIWKCEPGVHEEIRDRGVDFGIIIKGKTGEFRGD